MSETFTLELGLSSIILRIITAIIIGGIIGYERSSHNRPAGFRTHILVCLGAAIISITQDELRINIVKFAIANPVSNQVLKTDLGRMAAQVISGIGFLGAGSILREKRMVAGLTTAASIWATGCIGIGIGWGFYNIAVPAGVAVIIVLGILKKFERTVIEKNFTKKIEITYNGELDIEENIVETYEVFKNSDIKVKKIKKDSKNNKICYTLSMPKHIAILDIIEELSTMKTVFEINNL